jgi:hypothetical protein
LISAGVLVSLAAMSGAAVAQSTSPYPLFASEAPLSLRITAPLEALSHDDAGERPERESIVELLRPDGSVVSFDAEIRVRGRNRLENCAFPPLRVDFRYGQTSDAGRDPLAGTVFEGQNHLKLATLCRDSDAYRDYLALEYEIYRLFNALTDRSFRVRWAEIEYVTSDSTKEEPFTEGAFFIEEDWEVAERLGMEIVERPTIEVGDLDAAHMALFAVFQYLIGNTDWAVTDAVGDEDCCHNGKVLGTTDGRLFVLPYDFDHAGLIDAIYAEPPDNLPIRSVTTRLYRGFCPHNDELDAVVAGVNARRELMLSRLEGAAVRDRKRRDALEFLEESFARINDPKRFERDLIGKCRGQ